MLNYLGVKNSIRDLTNAFQYLPDTCFVPIEDGSSAYGEDKNHKLEYNQIKKSQHQWIINNVKSLLEEFNIDQFRLEWNKRLNIFPKTDMLIRLLTEAGRDLFRILLLIRN